MSGEAGPVSSGAEHVHDAKQIPGQQEPHRVSGPDLDAAHRNAGAMQSNASPASVAPTQEQMQQLQTDLNAIQPTGWQILGAIAAGVFLGTLSVIAAVISPAITGVTGAVRGGVSGFKSFAPLVIPGAMVGGMLGVAGGGAFIGTLALGKTYKLCTKLLSNEKAREMVIDAFVQKIQVESTLESDTIDACADNKKNEIEMLGRNYNACLKLTTMFRYSDKLTGLGYEFVHLYDTSPKDSSVTDETLKAVKEKLSEFKKKMFEELADHLKKNNGGGVDTFLKAYQQAGVGQHRQPPSFL